MRWSRPVEGLLWTIFAGATGYAGFCLWEAAVPRIVPPVLAQQATDTDGQIVGRLTTNGYTSGASTPDGSAFGTLSIPSLHMDVPIVEGLTRSDLLRGVGHVPGSATAGGLGNMALAAHRDTYFRPVRNIAPGMEILVRSAEGTYTYRVDTTEIVLPDQVQVLETGSVPQATLITCYPFDYIGAAPKRFIVHAHLTSLLPKS